MTMMVIKASWSPSGGRIQYSSQTGKVILESIFPLMGSVIAGGSYQPAVYSCVQF